MRLLVLAVVGLQLLWVASARAQSFAGTFTTAAPQGAITLTLRQDAQAKVTGTLSGSGSTFQVEGQFQAEDGTVVGVITGDGGGLYFEAGLDGDRLLLTLVEPDANGQPNYASARQLAFTRQAAAGAAAPAAVRPANPLAGGAQPGAGGARPSGQDAQLAQLFLSSAWCSFGFQGGNTPGGPSYGTTSTSRVVFSQDGTVSVGSNRESVSSNPYGTAFGTGAGGEVFRWKVEKGALLLSQDGAQWTPVNIQVNYNSNGYPIVVADGTEYMQCD